MGSRAADVGPIRNLEAMAQVFRPLVALVNEQLVQSLQWILALADVKTDTDDPGAADLTVIPAEQR